MQNSREDFKFDVILCYINLMMHGIQRGNPHEHFYMLIDETFAILYVLKIYIHLFD